MLKELSFQHYKAFEEKSSMTIKPVTVILGKNSSGKSSICKLIASMAKSVAPDSANLIPMRIGNVVLGNTYEDLFHNGVTSEMTLGLTFDDDVNLELSYIMQMGELYVHKYSLSHKGCASDNVFTNLKESANSGIHGIIREQDFQSLGIPLESVRFSIDYIGPLRISDKRLIHKNEITGSDYVGYDGSNAYEMLLNSELKNTKLLSDVSEWFRQNMDEQSLEIVEQGVGSGNYCLNVNRGNAQVNIADVGIGMAQVLPIIVQSFQPHADITIIEQPSLHLNPAAHATVAMRIVSSAKANNKSFIVETHSETFLLALKMMIADPNKSFTRDDLAIYYVDHNEEDAILRPIEIKENLEYSFWPSGLFEDNFNIISEIDQLSL
jgi:energy-coupling factor transporter ATP-binding protein EcfA2